MTKHELIRILTTVAATLLFGTLLSITVAIPALALETAQNHAITTIVSPPSTPSLTPASIPNITDANQQQPSSLVPLASGAVAQYCPLAKELTKGNNFRWVVGEKWTSYSESFIREVHSFVGAQWVGIRVGKIICLYQGKNSFDFPIALEQLKNKIILEPHGQYWSGLTQNRRFCKSTNVFDCPFFFKPPENIGNVYETIRYKEQLQHNVESHDPDF